VSKVKKATGVTGERNIDSGSGRKGRNAGVERVRPAAKKVAKRTAASKKPIPKPSKARGTAPMKKAVKTSPKSGKGAKRKAVASGVKRKSGDTRSKKGRLTHMRGRRPVSDAPVVTVAVRELDPLRKCGPRTTVQLLYRVDESVDGRRTAHLVFFDRHGWYCEHGRTCPAVGHAKKHKGQIARVS
jgi:hypothetical protein